MATLLENETIESIKALEYKAKKDHKDVSYTLAKGKYYYKNAISSVRYCGLFEMIGAAITFCASSISTAIYYAEHGYWDIYYVIGIIAAQMLVAGLSFLIGYKLRALNTTPRFVLFLLILSVVSNVVLFFGILPIVSLVFGVLSLFRWGTYKDWFYNFKK